MTLSFMWIRLAKKLSWWINAPRITRTPSKLSRGTELIIGKARFFTTTLKKKLLTLKLLHCWMKESVLKTRKCFNYVKFVTLFVNIRLRTQHNDLPLLGNIARSRNKAYGSKKRVILQKKFFACLFGESLL